MLSKKVTAVQNRVTEGVLVLLSLVVFIVIVFPLLFLMSVPLLLWRSLVVLWTKCTRKDIIKIMDGMDPVFATDDIHGRPLSTIVGMVAFENGMTYDDIITAIDRTLEDRNAKTGELLHPEFRSFYIRRLGFLWWKHEENFVKENHISIWCDPATGDPSRVITEDDFVNLVSDLECAPFERNKSPWEVILVKNCLLKNVPNPEKPKLLCVFRIHHGLADGMTMLHTFMKYFTDESVDTVAKTSAPKRGGATKVMFTLGAVLHIPYQFFKQAFTAYDRNGWHLPEEQLSRVMHKSWSDRISTNVIRDVKNRHRIGFTAVLIGAIAGAIRTTMIRNGIKVPRKIHAVLPFPWPKRPKVVGNHWSYVFVALPVSEPDPLRRMRKVHRKLEKLKHSPTPFVNFAILDMFNMMPTWLIEKMSVSSYLPTVTISNFPGPPSVSKYGGADGHQLVDAMFTVGPMRGNIGVIVDIMSYNGGIRIVTGVDNSIMPNKSLATQFTKEIQNQIFSLRQAEDIV